MAGFGLLFSLASPEFRRFSELCHFSVILAHNLLHALSKFLQWSLDKEKAFPILYLGCVA